MSLGNKPQITLTKNKSLSMWLKPTAFGSRRNPYSKAYGGTGTFTLEVDGTLNYFYGITGGDTGTVNVSYASYNPTQLLLLNEWVHVILVRNLDSMKISYFLRGILSSESTALFAEAVAGSGNTYFGSGYVNNFDGLIDDVRIYDRALSAVEVKALYELGEQPVQESGADTTTVVNGTVADGSITTNQLSEQILKYLKPEITQQPSAATIFADTNGTISVSAEGSTSYQWKRME